MIGYARDRPDRVLARPGAPSLTVTAFALFFFYKIRIVPEHFWMARRFLPIILPGALLLAAAAALAGVRGRLALVRALRVPIGGGLPRAAGGATTRARRRPVLDHVEYAGIIPRLEQLARASATTIC